MRISAVLAGKGSAVATVGREATLAEAVALLAQFGVGALVVSADGQHIDGIVSERDIVRRMALVGGSVVNDQVSTVMSASVHTCSLDDDTEQLMAAMTERRIRHVPVVDDGTLCGIVSIGDVVKSRIQELEKDRKELVDYITAR